MSSGLIVIIVAICSMIAGWIIDKIFPSNGSGTNTANRHHIDRAVDYMNNPVVEYLKSQEVYRYKSSDPTGSSRDL